MSPKSVCFVILHKVLPRRRALSTLQVTSYGPTTALRCTFFGGIFRKKSTFSSSVGASASNQELETAEHLNKMDTRDLRDSETDEDAKSPQLCGERDPGAVETIDSIAGVAASGD